MKNDTIKQFAPLAIFLSIALLLGLGLTLNPKDLPSTLINKPTPPFELPVLGSQERVSNKDYLGQRWLLNVWASWCVGCRVEHPLLNQLAKQTNIPILGLNYKDEADDAQQWLAQRGNPYSQNAWDYAGNVGIDWGVYGVPETFVIDEQGIIIYKHTGPLTVDSLRNEILPLFEDGTQAP